MSDTPETDAKVRTFEVPTKFGRHTRKTCVVHIEFARDLERRLVAVRTALRHVLDWAPQPPDFWRESVKESFWQDVSNARAVLAKEEKL